MKPPDKNRLRVVGGTDRVHDMSNFDPDGLYCDPLSLKRFINWSYGAKKPDGRRAKIPEGSKGDGWKNPARWKTRDQTGEQRGFVLGYDAESDLWWCGADCDGCLDQDGNVTDPQVKEVLRRFKTYAEVSPSGTGIKLFFALSRDDGRGLSNKRVTSPPGDHKGITFDIDRFYTVTDKMLDHDHRAWHLMTRADVDWLLSLGGGEKKAKDTTKSGRGFGFIQARRRDGDTYEGAVAKLKANKGRAGDWYRKWESEDPEELERQLQRAWDEPEEKSSNDRSSMTLEVVRASDVVPKAMHWLWPLMFALGKIGVIAGDPDLGKSLILLYMITVVSRGGKWPSGERAPRCNCILFTAEDDTDDTVVPRLMAAGADLTRVRIVKMMRAAGGTRSMFTFRHDLAKLEALIDEIGDVGLVGVDPITAYMGVGEVDSHRNTEMRGVLAPVGELAARKKLSAVLISHFNKNVNLTKSMHKIIESVAMPAIARHAYGAFTDPEDVSQQVFARIKNNLVKRGVRTGYSYIIESKKVAVDEGEDVYGAYLIPQEETTKTADEILGEEGTKANKLHDAMAFLNEVLEHGPKTVKQIHAERDTRNHPISDKTLSRAANELNITRKPGEFGGDWVWSLP